MSSFAVCLLFISSVCIVVVLPLLWMCSVLEGGGIRAFATKYDTQYRFFADALKLRWFPLSPDFVRIFIRNRYLILSNAFLSVNWYHHIIFLLQYYILFFFLNIEPALHTWNLIWWDCVNSFSQIVSLLIFYWKYLHLSLWEIVVCSFHSFFLAPPLSGFGVTVTLAS